MPYLKKNSSVRVVVDDADTRFSNFAIEYLRKNKKVAKPFLPVHMGPRSNLLSQKNGKKSRDTVPLRDISMKNYS